MNVTHQQEEEPEADHALPGRYLPEVEAVMAEPTSTVYFDVMLEAQRNLQTATAMIVAAINDVATRTHVAMRFADIFAWGDNGFKRAEFLLCCGVDEIHMRSSYFTLAEEM